MTDHLIEEVNEALRRERIEKFWRRFGQYVVAGSIGVLLLTVGYVVWDGYRERQHQAWSSEMLAAHAAMERGAYGDAEHMLEALIGDAQGELAMLVKLWLAEVRLHQKDKQGAEEALAGISDAPGVYGDFARLLSLSVDYGEERPVSEAFRYTALEQEAAELLAADEREQAAAKFKELAEDELAPRAMRERARLILSRLEPASQKE